MKKQLAIIGLVALLVSVGLSGCNEVSNTLNPEKNKFVGTWLTDENIIGLIFFSDGTGSYANVISTRWDIKDGKLVVILSDDSLTLTYSYAFSNNDKTLTLTSGEETVHLIKQ
jgi:hypothetical protein